MSVRRDPDNCDRHLAPVDALRRDSKLVSQQMSPRINGGGESPWRESGWSTGGLFGFQDLALVCAYST